MPHGRSVVTMLVQVAMHRVSVRPSLTGLQVVEKVSGSQEVMLVTSALIDSGAEEVRALSDAEVTAEVASELVAGSDVREAVSSELEEDTAVPVAPVVSADVAESVELEASVGSTALVVSAVEEDSAEEDSAEEDSAAVEDADVESTALVEGAVPLETSELLGSSLVVTTAEELAGKVLTIVVQAPAWVLVTQLEEAVVLMPQFPKLLRKIVVRLGIEDRSKRDTH